MEAGVTLNLLLALETLSSYCIAYPASIYSKLSYMGYSFAESKHLLDIFSR